LFLGLPAGAGWIRLDAVTLRQQVLALVFASAFSPASGQDRFPEPAPPGPIAARLVPHAVTPDSAPGLPPRCSLLAADPIGRLFVNDQRGPLYLIEAAGGAATEYLDLRDVASAQLVATSEAGFQSFAFHPDFHRPEAEGRGRFYLMFSSGNTTARGPDFDPGGGTSFHSVLLEGRAADPAAVPFAPASPERPFREVLRFKQPFGNHNAGLIAFNPYAGPDDADYGLLYVALGDGGSAGDPQENGEDPSNPYGALLRIDPLGDDAPNGRYGIPAANALAQDGDPSTLGEVFAYGFRNPQRFGWDAWTGALYVADIGQNAVEEINRVVDGGNYGWDHREGSFPFEGGGPPGLIDPVAEYDHVNPVADPPTPIGSRAVTCGEPIRGSGVRALEGLLPVADFPTGSVFVLDVDADPLDGGQDGLRLLPFVDAEGRPTTALGEINAARAGRGLPPASRADLRFGVGTPGRTFLINKADGVVRRLVIQPELALRPEDGALRLDYAGRLQRSGDLREDGWEDVEPQPPSPRIFSPEEPRAFFRVRSN